jgi:lipopolysaccharide heptosyltransferase II
MTSLPLRNEEAVITAAPPTQERPEPLAPARWDWSEVRRVLVVRLRSIGDTVLATPSLFALRRFLPHAEIDVLLESWVAPLLEGFEHVDNVIAVERGSAVSRARVARQLRARRYDVAYNLHGGTTATILMRAAGAKNRIGYATYQYRRLLNHAAPPASEIWGRNPTHSAEQQLALLGWTGVPVSDRPASHLAVVPSAAAAVAGKLRTAGVSDNTQIALIHPAAAFETKRWAANNFVQIAEYVAAIGLAPVAVVAPQEKAVAAELEVLSNGAITTLVDLTLPEVTALAARARIFLGNDSGIAHIATAVKTPAVVIFGSSNVNHWRPWSAAPSEVVREEMPCAPCPGYTCGQFDEPECIKRVSVENVISAVERVLNR